MNKELGKERVRITFIVTAKVTADTFVSKFAKFVAERGFYVTVIADGVDRKHQTIGSGVLAQVPIAMVREPSIGKDLKSLGALFLELRRNRPDILVYATPKASLLSALAGFALRVPTRIYQVWGLRLETTNGLKRKILAFMESVTSIFSTRILANSVSLATKYEDLKLNFSRSVDVLGQGSSHGVDLQYFSDSSEFAAPDTRVEQFLERKDHQLTIGFVGRLHPDKGIDTLLKSVEYLKVTGVKVGLLLFGKDEGANFDGSLECGLDFLKIDFVPDVRPYYSVMDLLVLPSLREGFPNVVLEAAAMGIPAIVSDGTGVVDSVVDGETGIIVPVGDVKSLAQAISQFSIDRDLGIRLGKAARKRAELHFSQEEVWQRTLKYFQQ